MKDPFISYREPNEKGDYMISLTPTQLKELGLDSASELLEKQLTLKRKLTIAYEHFRFVTPEVMNRFQQALKVKTEKIQEVCPRCEGKKEVKVDPKNLFNHQMEKCNYCRGTGAKEMTYDKLLFTKLSETSKIPPLDVLDKLKEAQQLKCFDYYEVAEVKSIVERPDPIIFGCIEGADEKFYIAQWDDDIKIEDILLPNEG